MLGVPRLESARLIHFEGPLALLPGDGATTLESNYPSAQAAATQAAATRSALFYNPFEDSPELGDHTFGGDGDAGGGVCWDEGEEESDGTGGAGVGGDGGGGDGGGGQGSGMCSFARCRRSRFDSYGLCSSVSDDLLIGLLMSGCSRPTCATTS